MTGSFLAAGKIDSAIGRACRLAAGSKVAQNNV
jgi:hypothetical protein